MFYSFFVIGGDLRQVTVANTLKKDGFDVNVMCLEKNCKFNDGINVLRYDQNRSILSDIVVLPLPCSYDGKTLNTPLYDGLVSISDLFGTLKKTKLIVGGMINEDIKYLCNLNDIKYIDYLEREELAVLNAIPTAEGAIELAMRMYLRTLHDSKCLVLGFGRIGKILSKMLFGIGAKVTVEARKYEDIAWIKSYGYNSVYLKDINKVLSEFDIIFNTIPSMILNSERLALLKKDCLVIDLASKPGGVDFFAADSLGIKTEWALSLPGKVAPITSGEIIKDTILNILQEVGEL